MRAASGAIGGCTTFSTAPGPFQRRICRTIKEGTITPSLIFQKNETTQDVRRLHYAQVAAPERYVFLSAVLSPRLMTALDLYSFPPFRLDVANAFRSQEGRGKSEGKSY